MYRRNLLIAGARVRLPVRIRYEAAQKKGSSHTIEVLVSDERLFRPQKQMSIGRRMAIQCMNQLSREEEEERHRRKVRRG